MNNQQDVDKHAKIAMVIISGIIIFLFVIATMVCNNSNTHEDVYVPRATITQETDSIIYLYEGDWY